MGSLLFGKFLRQVGGQMLCGGSSLALAGQCDKLLRERPRRDAIGQRDIENLRERVQSLRNSGRGLPGHEEHLAGRTVVQQPDDKKSFYRSGPKAMGDARMIVAESAPGGCKNGRFEGDGRLHRGAFPGFDNGFFEAGRSLAQAVAGSVCPRCFFFE